MVVVVVAFGVVLVGSSSMSPEAAPNAGVSEGGSGGDCCGLGGSEGGSGGDCSGEGSGGGRGGGTCAVWLRRRRHILSL